MVQSGAYINQLCVSPKVAAEVLRSRCSCRGSEQHRPLQEAALTWPSPSRQSCPTGLKGGKGNPLIKMSLLPLTSLPP
ncbi:hypothetical protein VZT92_001567 [Zoarces viviparus]|uniref:Uncharacterized protein n=1 Tax=Zoarces viviparus TaxID=48416 RepID=A0AAW1G2M6_ZOAVI